MRKIIVTFLCLVLASYVCPISLSAEESIKTGDESTIRLERQTNRNRPKIPAKVYLECHYSEGYIGFVLPEDAQSL